MTKTLHCKVWADAVVFLSLLSAESNVFSSVPLLRSSTADLLMEKVTYLSLTLAK